MKKHFRLRGEDDEGLRRALGVDFFEVAAPYIGPKLHPEVQGRKIDLWGIRTRWIEHGTGGYWDYCDFPLKDADEEGVAQWPMPSPDDFDYEALVRQCKQMRHYCLMVGNPGVGDMINTAGMIRTTTSPATQGSLGELPTRHPSRPLMEAVRAFRSAVQ